MRRLGALSLLVIIAASGCGRSNVYRYPPGVAPPPDGGSADGGPIVPACNPLQSDTYTLPTKRRPIDVLFIVDDSLSMKDDQDALAANFSAFITAFTRAQVDFHLGTVTTDMKKSTRSGRLVSPFLTTATPNLDAAFASMVRVGISGSGDERGIAAAHAALSEPLLSTTNAGFLRPDADMGLVFLSDENDHSPETVATFVTFLKGLKADASSMSIAAIVGLQSGLGCNTGSWRYVQVAHAFGPRGLVSTCDPDYASTLEAVSGRLIGTLCIVGLSRPLADNQHLRVKVNGSEWLFFRAAPDGIYPNGSIELLPCPETGGTVEVLYEECP